MIRRTMKTHLFTLFLIVFGFEVNGQIIDRQIEGDSIFKYYWDENQQAVWFKGKIADGQYRLYIDTILYAYVEIRKNKFNGAMIYFNKSGINEIGLVKNNKRIGIWVSAYYPTINIYTGKVRSVDLSQKIIFRGRNKILKELDFNEIINFQIEKYRLWH